MSNYNQYFQFEELNKSNNRRQFKLNYVNVKKEMFSGGGKGIWSLRKDTEYNRKVSPRITKKYLIERLYNQIDKAKVFTIDKDNKSIDGRKYHFLEWLELTLYFYESHLDYKRLIDDITNEVSENQKHNYFFQEDIEVSSLYGHSNIKYLDCLTEQLIQTKVQESNYELKTLARHIMLDVFYILHTEISNVRNLRDVIEYVNEETNLVSRLWTESFVGKSKITEIDGVDMINKFTGLYNRLYRMCHTFDKDTREYYFNKNKIYTYKLGYKWGFATRDEIRQIYKLVLINFDVDVIAFLRNEWEKNDLENKYLKFISYYYVELLQLSKYETTDDFGLLFIDKPIGEGDRIKSLDYYEIFKSDFYETFFDLYVSLNEDYEIIKEQIKGTYLTYYTDKQYKDDITNRFTMTSILINFYKCIDDYKLDVQKIPLKDLILSYIEDNKESISKGLDKIFSKKSKPKKSKKTIVEKNKLIIENNNYTIKSIPKIKVKDIVEDDTKISKTQKSINDLFDDDDLNYQLYENLNYDELYNKVRNSLYKSIVNVRSQELIDIKNSMEDIIKVLDRNNKLKTDFYKNRSFNEYDNLTQDELENLLYEISFLDLSNKDEDIKEIKQLISIVE